MSNRLKSINSALVQENRLIYLRKTSQIKIKELADVLMPPIYSQHFAEVYKIIQDNPQIFFHSHIEQFDRATKRKMAAQQTIKLLKTLKIDLQKNAYKFAASLYALQYYQLGTTIKTLIHYLVYAKTILIFKNNQYHQQILRRANMFEDIGSFSLTQLHHGSFSRGIATQAVYDKKSKQFIINSKGQEGMKFWIGGNAQIASKTLIWAQLIVNGVSYGPHCFIMPIRDDKTHQVLQGIIIGDCGPKNGLNTIDNGYLMAKNVRIPQKALLGKLGNIDENGNYVSKIQKNQQRFGLHMGPLSSGRSLLSANCLSQSYGSLLIAIRFACERRQFKTNQKQPQKLIIDYPLTRYRLMVPLAINIISYFPSIFISKLYIQNANVFTDIDNKMVNELHAMSAVIKAKTTWFSTWATVQCRQVLGGHGYSSFSGLNRYTQDTDVNVTWEGDNNMLLQQTSKFILKIIKERQNCTFIDIQFAYEGPQATDHDEKSLSNIQHLKICLQQLFLYRLHIAIKQISKSKQQLKKSRIKQEDIQWQVWNKVQPYFCNQLALSFGDLIYYQVSAKAIQSLIPQNYNRQFLVNCLCLWAQHTLLKASFDSLNTRKILQKLIVEGCDAIYPDCIAATDALAPPDNIIGSPFANSNGEGMKDYLNLVFSSKNAFGRVPWFNKLIQMKNSQTN